MNHEIEIQVSADVCESVLDGETKLIYVNVIDHTAGITAHYAYNRIASPEGVAALKREVMDNLMRECERTFGIKPGQITDVTDYGDPTFRWPYMHEEGVDLNVSFLEAGQDHYNNLPEGVIQATVDVTGRQSGKITKLFCVYDSDKLSKDRFVLDRHISVGEWRQYARAYA